MSWRVLRPLVEPILRALVGESVRLYLSPCCRVLWWQMRAITLTLRGRRARFARWRYRANLAQCVELRDEKCNAAEAADRVLAELMSRGDEFAADLWRHPGVRQKVGDLLGPEATKALYTAGGPPF